MKQSAFEERYASDWQGFEAWLAYRDKHGRRSKDDAAAPALADEQVPALYRRICQHLALARDRHYSPDLVDRLNRLALRGHHLLYGARGRPTARALAFLFEGFPRLVRRERTLVLAAAVLFFGPFLALIAALQVYPDFVYYLLSPQQLAKFREMYDPAAARVGVRAADSNTVMFAFYIWNNIKIGFQTFATGLAFGLGTIFYLLFNGVTIGAVAGYLTSIGHGTPFWSFVSGHSAMELVAIVISGAAGLKLGGAVIAPGRRTRKAALVDAARIAVRLMYGAALMFLAAAFIEAFWSPHTVLAPQTKFIVGAVLWGMVIGYFLFGGRKRRTTHEH